MDAPNLNDLVEYFRTKVDRPEGMMDVDFATTLMTIAQHSLDHGLDPRPTPKQAKKADAPQSPDPTVTREEQPSGDQ